MIVACTGHRPEGLSHLFKVPDGYKYDYTKVLNLLIEYVKHNKPDVIISGMAQGFDQLMAAAALANDVVYDAYMPFPEQDKMWSDTGVFGKQDYKDLLKFARAKLYVGDAYNRAYYGLRDRRMVDDADTVWACMNPTRKEGGTYLTVKYAEKMNKPVVNLWEYLESYL